MGGGGEFPSHPSPFKVQVNLPVKLNRIVTVTVTVTVTGVRVTVSVTLGGPNRTIGRHRDRRAPGPARGP